jgi:hypothetical protein
MRPFLVGAMAALSMLAGCGNDPTAASRAAAIAGAWQEALDVPGAFFGMTLTADGASLSGTGSYIIEAGPSGLTIVSGSASANEVNLDFVDESGHPAPGEGAGRWHFTGKLILNRLEGTLQYGVASPDNLPVSAVFVRQPRHNNVPI